MDGGFKRLPFFADNKVVGIHGTSRAHPFFFGAVPQIQSTYAIYNGA